MTEQNAIGGDSAEAKGDRRRDERRSADRRRDDRRIPPPWWRRPAAYVAYGVVGALLIVLFLRDGGSEGTDPEAGREAELALERAELPRPTEGARVALTQADYERLLAEGEAAVGQHVRVHLYCGSINPVSMRDTERPHPALASLVDSEGRVAGAGCRWSREARSSDFLLIVPPELAEQFARAPEVELNFVRRRSVPAEIVWLGRSDALALRNAGVLQVIGP